MAGKSKPRSETGFKQEKKPPKGAMNALRPLHVLMCAAEGGDWYERFSKTYLKGWRPRHPETGKIMNLPELMAWATSHLDDDEDYRNLTKRLAVAALLRVDQISRADIREAFDAEGKIKSARDLPDDVAAAMSGYKPGEIKFVNKLDAHKTLMQAGDKLAERHIHSDPDGNPLGDTELARQIAFILSKAANAT